VARQFSNTAVETVLAASATAAATSISVSSASGFPIGFPYRLTLDYEQTGSEIVEVTAASGTTLTVLRGVDGTSPQSHAVGAPVAHTATAQDFRDSQDHIGASAGVHGLTGGVAVVGTTATQTLTNKTIDGSSNTISNVNAGSVTGNFKSITTVAANAASIALTIKGFTGQTADLSRWLDAAGATKGAVDKDGKASFASLSTTDGGIATAASAGSVFVGKSLDLTAATTTSTPLKIKSVAAATADVVQALNSAAAVVFKITPAGDVTAAGDVTVGSNLSVADTSNLTQAVVTQKASPVDPVLRLKAQSAVANTRPFLQITNHLGADLAKVDELGFWVGPGDATSLEKTLNIPHNASVFTKVAYVVGDAKFDVHDRQIAATPTRINILVAGYYLVIHQAMFDDRTTGSRASAVRLNADTFPLEVRMNAVAAGHITTPGSSRICKLAVNDFLEHYVYQNSLVTLSTTVYMQVAWLGS